MTAAVERRDPLPSSRRRSVTPARDHRPPSRIRKPHDRADLRRADDSPRPRARSPAAENRSRSRSRSSSPRTNRLRRVDRVSDRPYAPGKDRNEQNKEKRRDEPSDRRGGRDIGDGGGRASSRPLHRESERERERERSLSPEEQRSRSSRRGSVRSPTRKDSRSMARDEETKSRTLEHLRDGEHDSVSKMKAAEEALETKDKQKPSFELSGKLAEETNRVRGVTLLFNEPSDARKPDIRWRLYVFKAGEVLKDPLYVHRQSVYLFGRERRVADIPTDHPSCSKQHAVIQYRIVEKEKPDGLLSKKVRPYLMDLGSTNGTFINDNRIEPQRYYELFEKDTVRFGNSSREYVLLHEDSMQ